MVFRQTEPDKRNLPPGRSIILLLIYFFIGLFVGQFLAVLCSMALFGLGFDETQNIAGNLQHPDARNILFTLQFFSAVGGFLLGPLYYMYKWEQRTVSALINKRGASIIPLTLAVVITLSFMMVNSILIEWNANITLPETFKSVEAWAKGQEAYMQQLTEHLTTFPSTLDFVVAFIIIALLPAFGEELLFRGLMQPLLRLKLGNAHVAIWLTAFIFSAIHFQFYGLFPRLFLGALFGYLYYWSGNLLMPILGHFINNGFSLLLSYFHQRELTELDISNMEAFSGRTIAVFLFLGIAAAVAYRAYFVREEEEQYEGMG